MPPRDPSRRKPTEQRGDRFRRRQMVALWLIVGLSLLAGPLGAGEWLTVRVGTMPVVLSAPHGGDRPMPHIPARQRSDLPKFQTVRDERTAELTEKLAETLAEELGRHPYVVILRAERKYVDVNRPAEHAYETEPAQAVYEAYHRALRKACDEIRAKWTHGLLLDVHGQTLEDGVIFRGTHNLETITALRQRVGPEVYRQLDRALEKQGFRVLPPAEERETRFTGGYIVQTYGSHHPDGIDAIQWEFGSELRQKEVLDQTARQAGKALATFVRQHYLK